MKKLIFTAFFALTALFSITGQAMTAQVISLKGKVEVMRDNAWKPLTEGEKLSRGDIVSTGFNSEAVIMVKESKITLSALTRMTVEQLAENDKKEQAQFFIDSGKLSASVKHAENKRTDFKVRSPVSTASVRGTDFELYATGKAKTSRGMLATSRSTSQTAEVADSDTPSDYLPPAQASSVFTSTKDVGNGDGIPLYAGQTSLPDYTTGNMINPQIQMISENLNLQGFSPATGASAADEGLAGLSAGGSTREGGSTDSAPAAATGSLTVNITLGN